MSTEEFELIQLLVEEKLTNKNFDENESSDETSYDQHRATENIRPPPPPPPEADADVDDMGHDVGHIPLYEGDEDPRRHWFVCESTWEANVVTSEDRQMV